MGTLCTLKITVTTAQRSHIQACSAPQILQMTVPVLPQKEELKLLFHWGVFVFFVFFVFLNLAQKTTRPSWRHRSHLTLQLGPVCTNVNDTLWSLAGDDIYLFDGAICDIFTALCQSMSSINICSVKTKNNCFDVTNRKKDPRLHTRRNNNIDQQEAGPLNVHNPRKELCDFLTRVEKSMHELNSLFNNSRSSNSSVPPQHFHGIFKV